MSSRGLEIGAEAETQTFDDARVRYGVPEEKVLVRTWGTEGIPRGIRSAFGCTTECAKPRWARTSSGFTYCAVLYRVPGV